MMKHKGYAGVAWVDHDAGVIRGRVIGLKDVITFRGSTVEEARSAFAGSVDDYLCFCAERGEKPEKPFSGKLLVRLDPNLHRELSMAAEGSGMSLNALVVEAIQHGLKLRMIRLGESSVVECSGETTEAEQAPRRRSTRAG